MSPLHILEETWLSVEWPRYGEVIQEGRISMGLSIVVPGDWILVLPRIFSVILGKWFHYSGPQIFYL